jgi:hypothetical protein
VVGDAAEADVCSDAGTHGARPQLRFLHGLSCARHSLTGAKGGLLEPSRRWPFCFVCRTGRAKQSYPNSTAASQPPLARLRPPPLARFGFRARSDLRSLVC